MGEKDVGMGRMRRGGRLVGGLFLMVALVAPLLGGRAAAVAAQAELDGDWEGESEDGLAFSFVVGDGGVLSVSYAYECDGETIFAGAALSDPTPIEDGAFGFEPETSGGSIR